VLQTHVTPSLKGVEMESETGGFIGVIVGGYTVILIQDGVSNTIKIYGGDSVIRITQGS